MYKHILPVGMGSKNINMSHASRGCGRLRWRHSHSQCHIGVANPRYSLVLLLMALLPALSFRAPFPEKNGAHYHGSSARGRGAMGLRAREQTADADGTVQDSLVMRVPTDFPTLERAVAACRDVEIVVEQGWHKWDGQLVVARKGVHITSQPHSSLTGRWVFARGSSGLIQRTSLLHSCVAGAPQASVMVLGGSGKGVGPWNLEHCRIYSHGEGSV